MSANFTPELNSYTDLTPFRYWCQKVLPLVYDDSLSYYELLCKTVDYLNKTMEDVNLAVEDVGKLHDAYDSLQTYVNTYFENLDVQEEINNKLDEMVEDGTLRNIFSEDVHDILDVASEAAQQAIEAIPDNVSGWLNEHVDPETGYVIDDTLTIQGAAADAKKTGDEISALKSDLNNMYRVVGAIGFNNWENGKTISASNGSIVNSPLKACNSPYSLQFPNKPIRFKVKEGYQCGCAEYTAISGVAGFNLLWNLNTDPKTGEFEFNFDPKKYYKFTVSKLDGTAMETVPADVITYGYIYLFDNTTVVVHNGDNLLEKLMYAETLKPNAKKVFVEAGTYDIIAAYTAHFGNSYFANYADNYNGRVNGLWDTGLWLQDIEVYFSPGANVTAHYTGDNAYVKQYFSAFSCGENVVIDGLTLDCSNVRYGIHADFWYGGEPCELAIRNCDLHCYTASDTSANANTAIEAGLPLHGNWVIENCVVRSDTNKRVIRIHNNVNAGAKSYVVIKDCCIVGDGHIEVNKYGASTEKTVAIVTGCKWDNPAVSIFDSPGSTNENIDFYSFGNTLRSDPAPVMYHSYNWCDPATITKNTGKYMGVDGTTGTDSRYAYTDMIPVSAGDIVYVLKNSMLKTDARYRYVTAFNADKEVVSASGTSTAGRTYTVPSGVAYVVLSIFLSNYSASDFSINVDTMMPFDTFADVNMPDGYKQATDSDMYIKKMPLTGMPAYIRNAMAYRPLQAPSKGYMCLVSDDGKEGLATYTCPMVIAKQVPCTFAVMSESEVFADDTLKATVLDAVNNHGCAISQHGGRNWTEYSEYGLNQFFDEEKAFFDTLGVSVKSAVIPSHYTTPTIQVIAGGRFGVVRSGLKGYDADGNYGNTVHNYYDFYTSGEGSNLFGLSSYNLSGYSLATNKLAIDYAYANNKILIVYWHENSLTAETKAVIEDAIDYAKTKGLEFITLDKIPYLTEVLTQF